MAETVREASSVIETSEHPGDRVTSLGPAATRVHHSLAVAFLDSAGHAFVATDLADRLVAWSAGAERLLGWSADEVLGAPAATVLGMDLYSLKAGAVRLRHRDGARLHLVVTRPTPLTGKYGAPLGVAVLLEPTLSDDPHLEQDLVGQRNAYSRALLEAVRVEDVVGLLAKGASEFLGAHRGVILRALGTGPDQERDWRWLVGHLALGGHQEHAERLLLPCEGPFAVTMVERRPALTVLDVGAGAEPVLVVPMGPSGAGWVLVLAGGWAPGEALATVADLATAMAGEAWAALRRVELVGELEAKVEILEATAAVSSSVGLDLDTVVEGVAGEAARALSCERAAIYLWEDERLRLAHLYGMELPVGADDGSAAAAAMLRTQVVVQDVSACPFLAGPWLAGAGTVSVLGLPLQVGDRSVGVLVVAHTAEHPRGFTNLCQQVGLAVAQQGALAIENARLFRNERASLQQLEELHRLKADYIDGITHDLKSPLTALLGFVQTLRRLDALGSPEDRPDDRAECLEIIERQANRLAGFVGDLLAGAQIEAGCLTPDQDERIDVGGLVREATESLEPDRRSRVAISVGRSAGVRGDHGQLRRVVENLLDNALKYDTSGAAIDVSVEGDGDSVRLIVADRGPGIPPELGEEVFARFTRGSPNPVRGSSGLGLYIVHGIVAAHGGEVRSEDRPGGGTVFEVVLPAAGSV